MQDKQSQSWSMDDLSFENDELKQFKVVVKSLIGQAEMILGELRTVADGIEVEQKVVMLGHCLDYTRRLCETHDRSL